MRISLSSPLSKSIDEVLASSATIAATDTLCQMHFAHMTIQKVRQSSTRRENYFKDVNVPQMSLKAKGKINKRIADQKMRFPTNALILCILLSLRKSKKKTFRLHYRNKTIADADDDGYDDRDRWKLSIRFHSFNRPINCMKMVRKK